jgi:serine/threonine protein phosphatase PrpC
MSLLRRIFGHSKEGIHMPAAETARSASQAQGPRLLVGRASDVGLVRSHNEDASLILESTIEGDQAVETVGLFVVADGMGGHQAGEVASDMAARIVASYLVQEIYIPYLRQASHQANQLPLAEALQQAVEAANQAVHEQVPGSGTTLTCALIINTRAYLAHVGDSRAYLYYNQELKQITRDHSYVDKLVELGQISPEAAAIHPQRNVLYRAVGQGDQLEIDIHLLDVPSGGRLLLCSDGLWGMLTDSIIQAVLASAQSPQDACRELIAAANEAGGRDNITAIVIEGANG